MNQYLARYAHLKYESMYKVGDKIQRYDVIGTIGNTGKSTGIHLHFDIVQKVVNKMYRMHEIPDLITDLPALMQQYVYFLDDDMFGGSFRITTYFADPFYTRPWKLHPGYDIVSYQDTIYWNRSKVGTIHMVGHDNGYGNYIIVRYKA